MNARPHTGMTAKELTEQQRKDDLKTVLSLFRRALDQTGVYVSDEEKLAIERLLAR